MSASVNCQGHHFILEEHILKQTDDIGIILKLEKNGFLHP